MLIASALWTLHRGGSVPAGQIIGELFYLQNVIVYFATAWIVGIVLALVIEVPVIHWRDRWFPSLVRRPLTRAARQAEMSEPGQMHRH